MAVHTESNEHGMRAIYVDEADPYSPNAADQLRISGNRTLRDRAALVTIVGPRGALKATLKITADDLDALVGALAALAAELKQP